MKRLAFVLLLLASCAKRAPSLGPDWKPYGSHGCMTHDATGEHTACCPTHGKYGVDYVCVTRDATGRIVLPGGEQ